MLLRYILCVTHADRVKVLYAGMYCFSVSVTIHNLKFCHITAKHKNLRTACAKVILLPIIGANMYADIYVPWLALQTMGAILCVAQIMVRNCGCVRSFYTIELVPHRDWDQYPLGRHDTIYIHAQSPLISGFILRRVLPGKTSFGSTHSANIPHKVDISPCMCV